jgi:ABC-type antimicrobial peptide transport system permease subunit
MRFVVASGFWAALRRLILVFGLLAVLFTVMARAREPLRTLRAIPIWSGSFSHSPWDFPIAIGIAVASVFVAALIYPNRPET